MIREEMQKCVNEIIVCHACNEVNHDVIWIMDIQPDNSPFCIVLTIKIAHH